MNNELEMQKSIIVTVEFEGFHFYKDAPKAVSFLADRHRHLFKVKAEIEVFHDDRELEFILVKRDLQHLFLPVIAIRENCGSCEMLATEIIEYLLTRWSIPTALQSRLSRRYPHRAITVEVWEDGENCGKVVYTPREVTYIEC